jgi:lipid-A-disaccharide synthase
MPGSGDPDGIRQVFTQGHHALMGSALRVGILAGESSGDILGAGLMQALADAYPGTQFEGIGGPQMEALGLRSMVPMERLSVMGLTEPLKRLPELLRIRRNIIRHFTRQPPDVFIGIDSPDFNLGVELRLRKAGIPTVHYVSPSVWAWRQGRIRKIAAACDLVLTLFPFEADFYHQHQVPVAFVGHPLADRIPLEPDTTGARTRLGLDTDRPVLAILPGSRRDEVGRLGPVFLAAAARLQQENPGLQLVLPCASPERKAQLLQMPEIAGIQVMLTDGQSRLVMEAADAALLASGTAALEAMLFKLPMLVCYRMGAISYGIISRLVRVPWFSLPNLLAGRQLVEELVQGAVVPEVLAPRLRQLLLRDSAHEALMHMYRELHMQLRQDASRKAAMAIAGLLTPAQ